MNKYLIVLFVILLTSCEYDEIIIKEEEYFIYNSLNQDKYALMYYFLEKDYNCITQEEYYNASYKIQANIEFKGLNNYSSKVIYIIPDTVQFKKELNNKLDIEINDSIWIEKTFREYSNKWILDYDMKSKKYVLTVTNN